MDYLKVTLTLKTEGKIKIKDLIILTSSIYTKNSWIINIDETIII
jgi:hypothetical protein